MSDKKVQHFVPRLYLKNFSFQNNGKTIGIYAVDLKQCVSGGELRHQCSSDFFYGVDPGVENALQIIEDKTAAVILDIINTHRLPPHDSQEYLALLCFVITLHLRTRSKSNEVNETADRAFKAAFKDDPRFPDLDKFIISSKNASVVALGTLDKCLIMSLDLACKVIINESDHAFITSDNPVILNNQYLYKNSFEGPHIGFATKGLQILLTLNSKTCLMFFDRNAYGVGNRKDSVVCTSKHEDIDEINKLIFIKSDQTLYYDHNVDEGYITKLITGLNRFRNKEKVIIKEHALPNKEDGSKHSILQIHSNVVPRSLNLSFVRILKKAKYFEIRTVLDTLRKPEVYSELTKDLK